MCTSYSVHIGKFSKPLKKKKKKDTSTRIICWNTLIMFRETRSLKSGKAKFSSYDPIHTKRQWCPGYELIFFKTESVNNLRDSFKWRVQLQIWHLKNIEGLWFPSSLFSPSNACHTLSTLFTRKKKKTIFFFVFIDLSFKTTHTFSQNKQKQITMKLSQYTRHFFLVFFISILNDYLQRE